MLCSGNFITFASLFKTVEKASSLVKLVSGQATRYLAEEIATSFGQPLGDVTIARFSDGEFQPSLDESVRGCDVFIIQSTFAPSDNLLELLMVIDATKRASAHYITAVIPYFGFSRQDRKDKPRVPIASKMVANLLTAAGVTRIMTLDLHAPQIQGFFDIPVDHLEAATVFIPYIEALNLPNLTIAAPDMGGTHRAIGYAKYFNVEMVICDKHRKRANEIASMTVIGDVEGKDIVIIDDLVDTAGTLTKAAELLFDKGANSVRAFCTHPVLSGEAYERIEHSRLTELVVCNTIPLKRTSPKIRVISVADLFAKAIHAVYAHESISDLFVKM